MLLVAVLLGCEESPSEPVPPFQLVQVRPRREQRDGVFLNEALVFHFDAAVDAASVTEESLAVRDAQGRVARGTYEVEGDRVRFLPDLGLARDLSDGGLLPGTRYTVELTGFPWPDGLRALDGRVLARSQRVEFVTAELEEPRGQMFEDTTPLYGEQLELAGAVADPSGLVVQLGPGESIELLCAEPLDPGTLADDEFLLRSEQRPGETVPLDVRLRSNDPQAGARLELRPRRRLAPGRYTLPGNLKVGLTDFGGHSVWYAPVGGTQWTIEVREEGGGRPEFLESFTGTERSLPIAVPGVDGAAAWTGDGRVTVRLPAAAGSGVDGEVRLRATESRRDVHALRLELEQGRTCELLSVPGLVVLRAQGRMVVSGELRRRAGPAPPIEDAPGRALSEWLSEAAVADPSWTVLVAGGDLVIDGALESDGPVLLAAGGRLRVTGDVRCPEGQLWLVGDGGGSSLRTFGRSRMRLDEPYLNPLRAEGGPLRFALVSGPVPPAGGVSRWIGAEAQGDARGGSWRVRYLPEDFDLTAPLEQWGLVDTPAELIGADALRLFLELEVRPPEDGRNMLWAPPFVDDVRLWWEDHPR
ncbi:MAG: Ig-like domain-containing protein [Planctomycetes bacterium]|nr:Ig-like domain-containing protein [Planctomycetota bacterium]